MKYKRDTSCWSRIAHLLILFSAKCGGKRGAPRLFVKVKPRRRRRPRGGKPGTERAARVSSLEPLSAHDAAVLHLFFFSLLLLHPWISFFFVFPQIAVIVPRTTRRRRAELGANNFAAELFSPRFASAVTKNGRVEFDSLSPLTRRTILESLFLAVQIKCR